MVLSLGIKLEVPYIGKFEPCYGINPSLLLNNIRGLHVGDDNPVAIAAVCLFLARIRFPKGVEGHVRKERI